MPDKYRSGESLTLQVERNGSMARTLFLEDSLGNPTDLTGVTFAGQVRRAAGVTGSPIAAFTISITDAVNGQVRISIIGSAFDAVEGVQEVVTLAYDIVATKAGEPTVILRGNFYVYPEVTQ